MSTPTRTDKLEGTLFGKTRRAVLSLLFSHPDESYYLRQLARLTGVGLGALQRELKALSAAGIIAVRKSRGRSSLYYLTVDLLPANCIACHAKPD